MCLYIDVSRETFTVANYLVFLSVVIVSRETILVNVVICLYEVIRRLILFHVKHFVLYCNCEKALILLKIMGASGVFGVDLWSFCLLKLANIKDFCIPIFVYFLFGVGFNCCQIVNTYYMVLDLLVIIVLCVCSAIGYKRGLIKSLVGLFSFIVAIIVARIILSMSIDTVSVFIEKFNIATPGLDGYIQSLFEGDGRLVLFLRGLLCVGGVENLTFLLVVVDIIGFLAITIVVKKIISLLMSHLCEKLFDADIVYSADNLFGTFVGFACGFVLCAAVCFVLIGLNAGVLEGGIDELISQSSLVEYFNVQFGVFEAMVHV